MLPTYRSLDPGKVIDTIGVLRHRIVERFPGAGLGEVCAELLLLAGENSARAEKIASRNMLRVLKAAEAYAAAHRGDPPIENKVTISDD